MTVYDDSGKPQGEPIQLYELQTREQMHQLMIDKGFHKKSQKESIQELQVEQREKQLKQLGDGTSLYGRQMGLYFVVLLVIGSIGVFFISGKRKKTRSSIAHSALVTRV